MTSSEIQQYVYDFLYDKGLPHKSIVAVMGNITGESSWSPDLIEVGSGVGYGLCQWSYSRRTQLEAYGTDLQHQCEFLWSELTGENTGTTGADLQWINPPSSSVTGGISFSCSLSQFRSGSDSVEFLTSAFCYCWERPAPATNHLTSTRIPSALSFNSSMSYGGTGGGDTGGGDTGGGDTGGGDTGGGTGGGDTYGDDYFEKYEEYFDKYDDLSEVYKKLLETPYIMKQLSDDYIIFLKTLNFGDHVHMKATFNHNKRQVGKNFLGNKLTFDNKEYKIEDVRNDGDIILSNGGNSCFNYVNPALLYQTDEEQAETKDNNVDKIKQHKIDEKPVTPI